MSSLQHAAKHSLKSLRHSVLAYLKLVSKGFHETTVTFSVLIIVETTYYAYGFWRKHLGFLRLLPKSEVNTAA